MRTTILINKNILTLNQTADTIPVILMLSIKYIYVVVEGTKLIGILGNIYRWIQGIETILGPNFKYQNSVT